MSYNIKFKVKVEDTNTYISLGYCYANTTWNVQEMIKESTGLPWENCSNNGYCKDVIPYIEKGYEELVEHPEKYRKYESTNGWGTVESTAKFFEKILDAWSELNEYEAVDVINVTTFWIE